MDIRGQVVDTARRIGIILNKGPQTFSQLQNELNEPSDILNLALGWLARDNRIEIRREERNFHLWLKDSPHR